MFYFNEEGEIMRDEHFENPIEKMLIPNPGI